MAQQPYMGGKVVYYTKYSGELQKEEDNNILDAPLVPERVTTTRWGGTPADAQKVGEFFSRVQAEASQPTTGTTSFPLNPNGRYPSAKRDDQKVEKLVTRVTNWRQPPMTIPLPQQPSSGALSSATNDVVQAVNRLKEAFQPSMATQAAAPMSSPRPRFMVPVPPPKGDGAAAGAPTPTTTAIDSDEARRRYGSLEYYVLKPYAEKEQQYAGTINSREAMEKYNGSAILP
ncbi:hypothetical protein Dimus_012261 [Dionaea muscipula]